MKNLVMDHYRNPRNTADLSALSNDHQYENPSCGDWIRLKIVKEHDIITDIRFQGEGCSLSIAAASMLTESLSGKPVDEAVKFSRDFIRAVTEPDAEFSGNKWGDLACFSEIRDFPIRQRCVILPFKAFIGECG